MLGVPVVDSIFEGFQTCPTPLVNPAIPPEADGENSGLCLSAAELAIEFVEEGTGDSRGELGREGRAEAGGEEEFHFIETIERPFRSGGKVGVLAETGVEPPRMGAKGEDVLTPRPPGRGNDRGTALYGAKDAVFKFSRPLAEPAGVDSALRSSDFALLRLRSRLFGGLTGDAEPEWTGSEDPVLEVPEGMRNTAK